MDVVTVAGPGRRGLQGFYGALTCMIPKVLHLCWISGDEYPPLVERCLLSWKEVLPDYEIIVWDAARINSIDSPWITDAISAKMYAFAADYVRLYALYNYGGIYLDSDVEVLKCFDPLLENRSFIGLETSLDVEAAVIGSVPGVAWLKSCLEYYADRRFSIGQERFDTKPLPLIIQEILCSEYGVKIGALDEPHNCSELSLIVYPPSYFSPKNRFTGALNITRDTYCIHHLEGKWVKRSANSLFGFCAHYFLARTLGSVRHKRIIDLYRSLRK